MAGRLYFLCMCLGLAPLACLNQTSFGKADLAGSHLESRIGYLLADGADAADVLVTLRQQDGTPVPGVTVTAACDGCDIEQPQAATDARGQASVVVRSLVPGTHAVRATVMRGAFRQALSASLSLVFYAPTDGNQVVAGNAIDLQVLARDANGAAAAFSGSITFTSTDPCALLPGAQTLDPDEHGHRIIPGGLTFLTSGTQTIEVTDTATQHVVFSETFNVVPGALASFDVTGLPETVIAGSVHTLQVRPVDHYGNAITGYTGDVALTSSDANAQLPGNYVYLAEDAGEHAFVGVTLVRAGTQTLTVEDANSTYVASTLTSMVQPAGVSGFAVTCAGLTAGVPCTATVAAQDPYANRVSDVSGTLALTSNDPAASFPPSLVLAPNDGGARTMPLTVIRGTGLAVQVSMGQISSTSYLEVHAGPLDHLTLAGLPPTVLAGMELQVQLQAQDMFNNINPGYRGIVRLASSDARATLPAGSLSFSATDAGQRTLPIVLKTTGTQQLSAIDAVTGLSVQAQSVVLSGNTVQAVFIQGLPAQVTAGVPMTGLVLQAVDSYGNPQTNYAGTVNFSSSDPLASAHASVTFAAMGGGTATVPGSLTLRTAGMQTITVADAAAPSLFGTQTVTVNAAAAAKTQFVQAPTGATACATFAQPVVVAAADIFNNRVPLAVPAHLNLVNGHPGSNPVLLYGTATVNPDQGVATFTDLKLNQAGSAFQLTASASGLASSSSGSFGVNQDPPTLALTQVSGTRGIIVVHVDLQTSCPAHLALMWNPNASGGWGDATPTAGASRLTHVAATGIVLSWDSPLDLPGVNQANVSLRVTATTNGLSTTAQSAPLTVSNGAGWGTPTLLRQANGGQFCLAHADLHAVGWDDLITCGPTAQAIQIFAAQGNAMFAAPQAIALPGIAVDVTIADFNRDGLLDLLVPIPTSNIVGVYLATAPGTFAAPFSVNVGNSPKAVRVADIDADGKNDLVATSATNQLAWILGTGAGVAGGYATQVAGNGARDLAIAPINRDAWDDAIVLNRSDATVSVLLGVPGGFAAALAPVAVGAMPKTLAAADINRDGMADAVVTSDASVTVLLGGSTGALTSAGTFAVTAGASAMTIADINEDGKLDVVVGNLASAQAWGVLLGDGHGQLATPAVAVPAPSGFEAVLAYDLRHAGHPDLLGVGQAGGLYAAPSTMAQSTRRGLRPFGVAVLDSDPFTMVAADFDGDANTDVIGVSANQQAYVYLAGDGTGNVRDRPAVSTLGTPSDLQTADFNADGAMDFAISSTTNASVAVYLNDGDGNFVVSVGPYVGGPAGMMVAQDLNADGKVDIAVLVEARNGVQLLWGDGNGTFALGALVVSDYQPVGLAAGDLNNDGMLDLLTANAAFSTVSSMLSTVPGVFGAPQVTSNLCAGVLGLADADHDGFLDVYRNCSGGTAVFAGDGNGFFWNQIWDVDGGWGQYSLAVTDINRDGWPDWGYPSAGLDYVLGGPGGTFDHHEGPFVTGFTLFADMDNDGWDELICNDHDGVVSVVPNQSGRLYSSDLDGWPQGPDGILVDINRDGILDGVSVYNGFDPVTPMSIATWLGDGLGGFGAGGPHQVLSADAHSFGNVGRLAQDDLNHDGWPDVVLADQINNLVNVWLSVGGGNMTAVHAYAAAYVHDVVTGDVDQDGDVDVVFASSGQGVSFLANDGSGNLAAQTQILNYSVRGYMALGDVDSDGVDDIVVSTWDGRVLVLWMTAAGTSSGSTFAASDLSPRVVAIADVDADGHQDVVFTYDADPSGVAIAAGIGGRAFAPRTVWPIPTALRSDARHLAVTDVNADGLRDVLITAYPKSMLLFTATAPGVLGPPQPFSVGVASPDRVMAADVNRDGRIDAISHSYEFDHGSFVILGQ